MNEVILEYLSKLAFCKDCYKCPNTTKKQAKAFKVSTHSILFLLSAIVYFLLLISSL